MTPMAIDDTQRYELWNSVLTEHCLLTDAASGAVSLAVTPGILSAALQMHAQETLAPGESEADFAAAVGKFYREQIVANAASLDALLQRTKSGAPLSVAFLALTVLAAYRMQTDDDHTGRAYYPRLAGLLGCDQLGAYPAGFHPAAFAALWDDLACWLRSHHERQLALPNGAARLKYLAFPMAHVPLRQVDIERLPQFFDAHGYEPRMRASLDRLSHDLYNSGGPWRYFTEAGRGALADENRRALVVRQVALELEHWDGARTDGSGRRKASIEIWMDIRQRRARLYLLARRPPGFPETIAHGDLLFRSQEDGWYEPIPLGADDGSLLEHGVTIQGDGPASDCVLNLRPIEVLPLTPSEEFSGFVSDGALPANTPCAVLCSNTISDEVARHLAIIANTQVRSRQDDTLPRGWSLFADVTPVVQAEPPCTLGSLRVENSVGLSAEGGLRFGRRWTWLEGGPPRIRIIGAAQLAVSIDGQNICRDAEGHIPTQLLASEGQHLLQVGNQIRRRIAVMPASVNPNCAPWECAEPCGSQIAIPLPAGTWTLVGAEQGTYTTVVISDQGGLALPGFSPSWALGPPARSHTTVLHLHPPAHFNASPTTLKPGRQARSAGVWAEAIYQVHVRRPRIVCTDGCQPGQLALEWRRLFESARAAKRRART
jgi:hypothetical protein